MKKQYLFKLSITFLFCMFYQFVSAQSANPNLVRVIKVLKADCNSKYGSVVIERSLSCEITLWFTNKEGFTKSTFQKTFSSSNMIDTLKNLELGSYVMQSKNDFNLDVDNFKMESYTDLKIESTNKNIICGNKGTLLFSPYAKKYLWSTGDTVQMISVKNPGKVSLTIVDPFEKLCSNKDSIDLILNPEINIEVFQSKSSCDSDSTLVQYKVTGGKKPYKISYQPYKTCFEGCLMPTDTIKYLKYIPYGYFLYVKDSNNCSQEKVFNLNPNSKELKLSFNKVTKLCLGDSIVYDDKYPDDDKHTHQWYRNGEPIPNENSSKFSTKVEGSYYVKISTPSCEIFSDTNTVELNKRDSIECIVPSNQNCLGVDITFEAPEKKINYNWYFPNLKNFIDYKIIEGGNFHSNKLVVKWLTAGEKNIYLYYSNGICPAKEPLILKSNVINSVNIIPLSPLQMSICQGIESTYKVANSFQNSGSVQPMSLTWDVPGAIKGVDYEVVFILENEITIKWLKPANYNLIVTNNEIGSVCDGNKTIVFNIIVNPIPQPTITADKGMVCFGDVVEYKTEAGNINYEWTIPNKTKDIDYSILEGGDLNSSTMKIIWKSQGFNQVSVNYLAQKGLCYSTTPAYTGTQVRMPIELIHITPEKSDICLNSIETYKVKDLNSNSLSVLNLNWVVSGDPTKDFKVIAGGTNFDSFITIQWLKASKKSVFVSSIQCGNSIYFNVNVHDIISQIELDIEKSDSVCKTDSLKIMVKNTAGKSVQWYFNDQQIPNATDTIYYAKNSGKYNVLVKNDGSCSLLSDYFEFKKDTCNSSVAGIKNNFKESISMYPNPATTVLTIDTKAENIHSISFIDVLGKSVLQQELKGVRNEVNLEGIAKGMYVVSFFNDQNEIISTQKLSVE